MPKKVDTLSNGQDFQLNTYHKFDQEIEQKEEL